MTQIRESSATTTATKTTDVPGTPDVDDNLNDSKKPGLKNDHDGGNDSLDDDDDDDESPPPLRSRYHKCFIRG